jgi:hypothetical protein
MWRDMKLPEWKQLGPKDQSTAIMAGLMWDVEILEIYPDMIPTQDQLDRMKREINQLKVLCQYYLPERW